MINVSESGMEYVCSLRTWYDDISINPADASVISIALKTLWKRHA